MHSPIVYELISVAKESMDVLRNDISDVIAGPIVDGVEYVNFKFRGESKSVPLANPDLLIVGDGRVSDRSIALRSMLATSGDSPGKQPNHKHRTKRSGRVSA
jgi:hypothetical protein